MSAEPTKNDPGPGIYPGVPFLEYLAWGHIDHSLLVKFNRTPAHAREAMLHPKDSTSAQEIGQALHARVLEPALFATQYVVPPKVDRRFKVGKEAWAAFEAENPGKLLLEKDEAERIEAMARVLAEHETARELLFGRGQSELSIVWDDPDSGLRCKARLDRLAALAEYPFIADLKSTKDAAERPFSKDMASFGYHQQAGFYRWGLDVLRPHPRRFAFAAIEKEPPYCVAVHELDERALEQGLRESQAHLRLLKECMESETWPAYGQGVGLIDLPPYAVDKMDLGA